MGEEKCTPREKKCTPRENPGYAYEKGPRLKCVPCPRSYCNLFHVNLYVLLLLLLTLGWGPRMVNPALDAATCFIVIVDPCEYTWTSQPNTYAPNGRLVSTASTLDQCQWACIRHDTCTGVDFSLTPEANQRCWMTGPWSGQLISGSTFTHYEWIRNCKIQSLFCLLK